MAELPPKVLFQNALRAPELRVIVKACGWSLSTFMGGSGLAWPSMAAIAEGAGCHERTARKALRELEARGWLEVRRSPGRVPNLYRVNPGAIGPGFNPANPGAAGPGFNGAQPGPWESPTRALGAPNPGAAGPGEGIEGVEGVAGGRAAPGGEGQARGDESVAGGLTPSEIAQLAREMQAEIRRLETKP